MRTNAFLSEPVCPAVNLLHLPRPLHQRPFTTVVATSDAFANASVSPGAWPKPQIVARCQSALPSAVLRLRVCTRRGIRRQRRIFCSWSAPAAPRRVQPLRKPSISFLIARFKHELTVQQPGPDTARPTPRNRPQFARGALGDSARRTPCRACNLGRRGSRRNRPASRR